MDSNETEGVCYKQPRTLDDRLAIARDFVKRHEYDIPFLVDSIDNRVDDRLRGLARAAVHHRRDRHDRVQGEAGAVRVPPGRGRGVVGGAVRGAGGLRRA